jgi:hypothetical protein
LSNGSLLSIEKGSALKINGFESVILKSVNVIKRDGKTSLIFVEFVDTKEFESTGQFMFINKEISVEDLVRLEKKSVSVQFNLGLYNNRPSLSCVNIIAL